MGIQSLIEKVKKFDNKIEKAQNKIAKNKEIIAKLIKENEAKLLSIREIEDKKEPFKKKIDSGWQPRNEKYKHYKILKTDEPLRSKLQKLEKVMNKEDYSKLEKHYSDIFEFVKDDLDSLDNKKNGKLIDLDNIKHNTPDPISKSLSKRAITVVEKDRNDARFITGEKAKLSLVEQVVSTIFNFICLNDIDNYEKLFYNFKINDGSFVNELVTKSSTYYFNKEKSVKIHVLPNNYHVLKDYRHPLNFIFYRNTHVMDYYICRRDYNSGSFKLDNKSFSKILKGKSMDKPHVSKIFNYFSNIEKTLSKQKADRYKKAVYNVGFYIRSFTKIEIYPVVKKDKKCKKETSLSSDETDAEDNIDRAKLAIKMIKNRNKNIKSGAEQAVEKILKRQREEMIVSEASSEETYIGEILFEEKDKENNQEKEKELEALEKEIYEMEQKSLYLNEQIKTYPVGEERDRLIHSYMNFIDEYEEQENKIRKLKQEMTIIF